MLLFHTLLVVAN